MKKLRKLEKSTKIKIFKRVSILEAVSFLLLLFIAMPLKYMFNSPAMVGIVGMAHGILFISYLVGALVMYRLLNWKLATLFLVIVCSVLPFGPFYVEKKIL